MGSEHNTLASASCLGRQPNTEPAPSAFRDNNIITGSMKDKHESLIMEGFETIIHNCLTKYKNKYINKQIKDCLFEIDFQKKKNQACLQYSSFN